MKEIGSDEDGNFFIRNGDMEQQLTFSLIYSANYILLSYDTKKILQMEAKQHRK